MALRLSQRAFRAAAAQVAIGRIEDIVKSRRKQRCRKKVDTFNMTARELEVLQQRALLGSSAAIAKALDISVQTVDVHFAKRSQKDESRGYRDRTVARAITACVIYLRKPCRSRYPALIGAKPARCSDRLL